MATVTLNVSGMTCRHCVHTVQRALESMEGVERANVDLEAGRADVEYDDSRATPLAMAEAVSGEGYPAHTI